MLLATLGKVDAHPERIHYLLSRFESLAALVRDDVAKVVASIGR